MDVEPTEGTVDPSATETDSPNLMLPVESRSANQSPLRPGSTLAVYQPNGISGLKTSGKMGKSQHLAQIRSLGLLHDLQEYISSVECLAAEQKRELEKVREEKRDIERCLARAEVAAQERPAGPVLDFSVSEVADLPPRLRALVEDNRGLRELVKRYKLRNASLEHQTSQLQAQVLALADANERLKQSLAECSRTPAEVDIEETLRRLLEVKGRQVENLEHGMGVLRNKLESDSKLYRQNLTSAAREKDALKRQLVTVNKTVEERDKEIRALNVELRRLRRGAPPTRGGPTYHPPVFAVGGAGEDGSGGPAPVAAAAAAAVEAAPPPAAPAAVAVPPSEERIRIMLLVVRDEVRVEVPVVVPLVEDTPATPLEGSPRGCSEVGERPLEEKPQQSRVEPQAEPGPDPAPEPSAPEPCIEPAADAVSEATAPEPAAESEPTAPEPPAEEASARELVAGTAGDVEYEPSVVGLMEEGTLAAEVSVGGMDGLAALEEEDATAAATAAAAVDAAEEAEPRMEVLTEAADGGNGGGVHVHASAPLPVPYSRTAARAVATKVGSISAKISTQPPPGAPAAMASNGGPGAAAVSSSSGSAVRKPSGGGGGAAAAPATGGGGLVNTRGGPSLKAVGAASRR